MSDRSVKVTVVIPTYNRKSTIARAIRSVLDQSFTDLEVLVVDDGSTDETEAVVEAMADPRVRFLRPYSGNRGPSAARNAGIELASGDFIAFQDSDDEWVHTKLELELKAFAAAMPEVGVVYGTIHRQGPNHEELVPHPSAAPRQGDLRFRLLEGNLVGAPSALIKKKCLEEVGGFDPLLRSLEDWDLFLRLSEVCEFAFVDKVVCNSFELSDSINVNRGRRIASLGAVLEKHKLRFETRPKAYMGFCLEVARGLYLDGDVGQGKEFLRRGFRAYPARPGPLILRVASCFGRSVFLRASALLLRLEGKDP